MGEAERMAMTLKGGLAWQVCVTGAAAARRGRAREAMKVFILKDWRDNRGEIIENEGQRVDS